MDTFKESQLHGNDRNHFIQNGGSAPQSNLADSSAADAAKPEISGDSTPNVLNTDELFRMAPDMVPLQQKAEELMYSSQVLMNGALIFERWCHVTLHFWLRDADHFNKASILMQESYNAVVNASVARQQVIMNLVEAIFAQRRYVSGRQHFIADNLPHGPLIFSFSENIASERYLMDLRKKTEVLSSGILGQK
jgi:prophage DNA circulation protein